MQGKLLPDTDEEILRNLNCRKWDNQKAFDSMKFKVDYQKEKFPIKFTDNMFNLMNCGGLYIYGRDKNLRPIVICDIKKLMENKDLFGSNSSDLINVCLFMLEWMETFMFVEGRVENFLLIVDCKGIGVFSAPYLIFKQVMNVIQEYAKGKIKATFCLNTEVGFGMIW